jgi:curli biogenesis system outer membrane secretion channel CsgG
MKTLLLPVLVGILATLLACASKSSSAPMASEKVESKGSSADYYAEESFKGRTYVFGTEKSHQAFQSAKQTPGVNVTYIGDGPSDETVVLEADAKAAQLQERLKAEFNRRHGTRLP